MAGDETNAETIALQALVWILQEEDRATRLLGLTGMTPDYLRENAGDPRLLGAILGFLEAHEPDLIACAHAIEVNPAALIGAGVALSHE